MAVDREQMLTGYAIAMVCLAGLIYSRWFLNSTRKGRWLLVKFGPLTGLWILRGLFALGLALGLSLAQDWIRSLELLGL